MFPCYEKAKSSGPIKTAVDAGKVVNPTGVSATVVTNAKHTSTIATSNKGCYPLLCLSCYSVHVYMCE